MFIDCAAPTLSAPFAGAEWCLNTDGPADSAPANGAPIQGGCSIYEHITPNGVKTSVLSFI